MAGLGNLVSNPSEDHGPLISAATWTVLAVSGVFLVLREYIRLSRRKFWIDDALLILAWWALLVYGILTQLAVNIGFGKHLLDIDLAHTHLLTRYGASGLSVGHIAINLGKISFGLTLLPLTSGVWKAVDIFAIITLVVFGIPVTILPWVQCDPLVKTFVSFYPGVCHNKQISVNFGVFQGAWSAAMDFLLASLPWQVIWGLQMKPIEKLGVGCAMSLGWLAGAAAIMRCINLSQLAQMDMSYDSMDEIVWTATEAGVTIIASSIPILRVYVQDKLALASARRHVPPASPSSTTPFSGMPHSPRPSRTGSVPLRPVSSRSSKRDGSTRFSLDQMVSGESDSEKRILPIKLNRRLR